MLNLVLTLLLLFAIPASAATNKTITCRYSWHVFSTVNDKFPMGKRQYPTTVSAQFNPKEGVWLIQEGDSSILPNVVSVFKAFPIELNRYQLIAVVPPEHPFSTFDIKVSLITPGGTSIENRNRKGEPRRASLSIGNDSSGDNDPRYIPVDVDIECSIE